MNMSIASHTILLLRKKKTNKDKHTTNLAKGLPHITKNTVSMRK